MTTSLQQTGRREVGSFLVVGVLAVILDFA